MKVFSAEIRILSGKIAFCAALWYAFCVDTERGENHDF